MTICATDVVAPVFATTEVIVLFSSRMTRQAGFRDLLCGLVFEGDDLRRIAFLDVRLAWSMTCFTSGYLVFPTAQIAKLRM